MTRERKVPGSKSRPSAQHPGGGLVRESWEGSGERALKIKE